MPTRLPIQQKAPLSRSGLSHQDAIILRRLRIGHTRLLNRKDPPQCSHCYYALTAKHVLLDCDYCRATRQRSFNAFTLKELFDTASTRDVLGFIRDVRLYHLI